MNGKLLMMFLVLTSVFLPSKVEATGDIVVNPPDVWKNILDRVDNFFSCSKFDGYAACYHNDWKLRDSMAAQCKSANRWSYDFTWGGRCYCVKCV